MNIATRNVGAELPPLVGPFKKGFTLVEVIVVIALLGVLSVYAAPRLFNSNHFIARGFHDETLSFLRFARQTAIAQRRTVCVVFTPNSLTMNIASAPVAAVCDTAMRGPKAELPATLTAKAGASYRVQPANFNFDALGRPVNAAGSEISSQSITVNGATQRVTVETETGFVHD